MSKLATELQRLYPTSPEGTVRAMVISFAKASDWEKLANLFQAVQNELDLPTPAISISGDKGFGLWFSLAEPVSLVQATDFLTALRDKYLAELPAANLELLTDIARVQPVPKLQTGTGKWSAYIDPTLGGMFADEPWLEMEPNQDKQADMLAALKPIAPEDFERARVILQTPAESPAEPDPAASEQIVVSGNHAKLRLGSHFNDPQSFLLAVMNDETASADQRIQAATALLPYFAKPQ